MVREGAGSGGPPSPNVMRRGEGGREGGVKRPIIYIYTHIYIHNRVHVHPPTHIHTHRCVCVCGGGV